MNTSMCRKRFPDIFPKQSGGIEKIYKDQSALVSAGSVDNHSQVQPCLSACIPSLEKNSSGSLS
ncbi:MAG: hypothetical protein IIY52_01875, partial [Solobacterium sp.]|nr:hypothetical protein [Solobacterium sp.]